MKNSTRQAGISNASLAIALGLVLSIAGCGGGNETGSTANNAASAGIPASDTSSAASPGNTDAASSILNVAPVTVEAGPSDTPNIPFTSVTVCAPGDNARCQTIDHVIVDTGSVGLRLFSSLLSPSLSLPVQTAAAGAVLAECTQFADGFTWGAIKLADIQLAGKRAGSIPIQVMGDPSFAAVPADCANTGRSNNSVQAFGANGILGVGVFLQDCGIVCEQAADNGIYYACSADVCHATATPLARQLQHPVSFFADDNNGVMLSLPPVPASGASAASGSLIFGIGTRANNGLGNASIFAVGAGNGSFTTVYKGKSFVDSFIDSGSNGIFFFDASIQVCAFGFYCPPSPLMLSATNHGANGTAGAVGFVVADVSALLAPGSGLAVSSSVAGPIASSSIFDWGLPFFFGRNVFTAIEGKDTPGGPGPYFAY